MPHACGAMSETGKVGRQRVVDPVGQYQQCSYRDGSFEMKCSDRALERLRNGSLGLAAPVQLACGRGGKEPPDRDFSVFGKKKGVLVTYDSPRSAKANDRRKCFT
jgi:hypothetical protein